MLKLKLVVLALIMMLAAAFLMTGCSMFGDETSSSERLAVAKTVGQSLLKIVCVAYNSGGNSLAEAQINQMVTDGKITESQATALKSMLDGSVSTLENLANREDSTAENTTEETAPDGEVKNE